MQSKDRITSDEKLLLYHSPAESPSTLHPPACYPPTQLTEEANNTLFIHPFIAHKSPADSSIVFLYGNTRDYLPLSPVAKKKRESGTPALFSSGLVEQQRQLQPSGKCPAATLLSFKTSGRHVSSCCVSGPSPAGPSTCSSVPRRRLSPSRTASLSMHRRLRQAPLPASAPDHGRGPCPLSSGRSPWQQDVPPGGRQRPRWQTALTTFLHSPCRCCCFCSAGDMQLVLPAVLWL